MSAPLNSLLFLTPILSVFGIGFFAVDDYCIVMPYPLILGRRGHIIAVKGGKIFIPIKGEIYFKELSHAVAGAASPKS